MALVKGFSVLLAAIVLPFRADFETEDKVAALKIAFRLVTSQTFVTNVVRMSQFLFVFSAGLIVTAKQLVHL